MLSAPWIVGPITPCSRKVKLQGLLYRAVVHIMANSTEIGSGAPAWPEALIDLTPGVQPEPGWGITAWQERGGDQSDESPIPYRVLKHPTRAALEHIFLLAPPVACGTCLGLGGIVPGATVTVQLPGRPAISVVADWTEVHIDIPDGLGTGPFTVQQTACAPGGRLEGPVVAFPPPLEVHRSGAPLPAPSFDPEPQECQRLLRLSGVQPGTTITLQRSAGQSFHCSGSPAAEIFLPEPGLAGAEAIVLAQEYAVRECRRAGAPAGSGVHAEPPPPPWFGEVPCLGQAFVTVGGLTPGAEVRIFADDDTTPLVVGAATAGVSLINLPQGWAAKRLSVRQVACEDGAPSAAGRADVMEADGPPPPQPFDRLHECATGVAVEVADRREWEPGLDAGTLVSIISHLWHGVIGRAVATGDHFTDVEVWLPLVAGDQIQVEALRCGQTSTSGSAVAVASKPAMLPAPSLEADIDDCGGSIWVNAIPGVIVDLDRVETDSFDANTAGILLACVRVNRGRMPVPVPPLPPGALLRVRARRCGERSLPSAIGKVGDAGLRYDAESAFRICQLTGGSDPAGRPHPNDTRGITLEGTDLGIPVDHLGKLWLFFGDAKEFEFGPFGFAGDHDPFAWTTDGPEPVGPHLHFPADDTDVFVQLLEEAVGAGIGAIVGGVLGFLAGGVAYALATGVGAATIGAAIGWFIDVIPDKTFRRLTVKDLPDLDNFEVPTGGFSHDARLFLFVARDPAEVQGEKRMRRSHLAVSKTSDPGDNFDKLHDVSSTGNGAAAPAGPWLVHVSPTVIRNEDWPDLPASQGAGLLMFGTGLYHGSNVRLAWAPLTPGQAPPSPATWRYFVDTAAGPAWLTRAQMAQQGVAPKGLLTDIIETPGPDGTPPVGLGELSVSWSPLLRRWILMYSFDRVECRVARDPRGPWGKPEVIFNRLDPAAAADNGPVANSVWVGLDHADKNVKRKTVTYAPYQVPRWTRFDRSTRTLTLYYTLSVEDPPYNSQLMRARLTCR